MNAVEKLRGLVDTLEAKHDLAVEWLEKNKPGVDPYEVQNEDGRFILLDSLTALVNATAALTVMMPPTKRPQPTFNPPWLRNE